MKNDNAPLVGYQAFGLFLRWSARLLAVVFAGTIFLFLFGQGLGPRGTHTMNLAFLSWQDRILLAMVIGATIGMLLGWRWEKWAGLAAMVLGFAFLLCTLFIPRMERAWFLGVALAVPGLPFMTAAHLRHRQA